MNPLILVACISVAGSLIVAVLTLSSTKKKERDADWRKLKLEHYRELLDALSGVVGSDSTPAGQRRWARAVNNIGLIASQEVLAALRNFQGVIAESNKNASIEGHDLALNRLMLALRADLDISPKDDPETFSFKLWCSGASDL